MTFSLLHGDVGLLSNLGCDVVAKGLLVLLLVVILRRGFGAAVERTHPVLCSHWLVCIRSAEQEELCCSTYLRVLVRVPVPQAVEQSLQSPQLVVSQDSGAGLDLLQVVAQCLLVSHLLVTALL